jgi:hypothetical protein
MIQKLKKEQMLGIRLFMLTKRCFNVNDYLKEQSLDYTGQQSEQLLHMPVKHGY